MCGIVGIYYPTQEKQINVSILHDMNDSLFHRGPDESGTYIDNDIGLGHRRLSIIDLSSGQQPMFNEDHSVVVVYNGEIYNFKELMNELKSFGHIFKTNCDTEVIVHAWEEWGQECVKRFRGMFAFAIWDKKQKTLFLARDRLGIKPLYFAKTKDESFIFASELKALLKFPSITREIDPESIEDYFSYGYVPEPKTIFKNIFKLEPATTLTLSNHSHEHKINTYWDIPFENQDIPNNYNDIKSEIIDRLDEATRIRLIAEVPLGAFLSGGIDSSAVVSQMKNHLDNITTCTIEFGEKEFNEGEYARLISRQFGTSHHYEKSSVDDFSLLKKLSEAYDEPFADPSAIPTYKLCELTKKHVTVALSGDGGDENFAGYSWYYGLLKRKRLNSIIPRSIFGITSKLMMPLNLQNSHLYSTIKKLSQNDIKSYSHSMMLTNDHNRFNLYTDSFKKQLNGYNSFEVIKRHVAEAPSNDILATAQYLDMKMYLPGDILTKVDRASMAHSLEVRVPMLDHKFVEWVSAIPTMYKRRGKSGKHILKQSLEDILPHDILYRKKMGFSIPIEQWFRKELKLSIKNICESSPLADTGIINMKKLNSLLEAHCNKNTNAGDTLYSILMFNEFLKTSL